MVGEFCYIHFTQRLRPEGQKLCGDMIFIVEVKSFQTVAEKHLIILRLTFGIHVLPSVAKAFVTWKIQNQ